MMIYTDMIPRHVFHAGAVSVMDTEDGSESVHAKHVDVLKADIVDVFGARLISDLHGGSAEKIV